MKYAYDPPISCFRPRGKKRITRQRGTQPTLSLYESTYCKRKMIKPVQALTTAGFFSQVKHTLTYLLPGCCSKPVIRKSEPKDTFSSSLLLTPIDWKVPRMAAIPMAQPYKHTAKQERTVVFLL